MKYTLDFFISFMFILSLSMPQGFMPDSLFKATLSRSGRVSSAAPTPQSNRDNIHVKPGGKAIIADIKGPAVIRHIWLTFNEARPNWISKEGSASPSEVVIRMYWDNAKEPAVEAPLGDFFAAGFGVRTEVKSIPVQVEGGDGYNCYWPMPFHKRALITITNESNKWLRSFYYHIDYEKLDKLPENSAYFCAQYRQEFPEKEGKDYLVLDAEGRGHYVGTVISVRTRSPAWFGEGDDKFYIDGEDKPSIWGTGTEDYFLCAWGLNECCFPCFGCPFMDGRNGGLGTRYVLYRWHIFDPIHFTKSLKFVIEHKGWMTPDETTTGKVSGHVEREDDIASVAFWYQIGQPKRFAPIPPLKERVWPELDVFIESKTLLKTVKRSPGEIRLQKGFGWTGDGQIFFKPKTKDAFLQVEFTCDIKERFGLVLRLTRSYDYGIYRILIDGKIVVSGVDLYNKYTVVKDLQLDFVKLSLGKHILRFECIGKNPFSKDYYIGLDSIRFRKRWNKKRKPLR